MSINLAWLKIFQPKMTGVAVAISNINERNINTEMKSGAVQLAVSSATNAMWRGLTVMAWLAVAKLCRSWPSACAGCKPSAPMQLMAGWLWRLAWLCLSLQHCLLSSSSLSI
jgi:hypothetical protein